MNTKWQPFIDQDGGFWRVIGMVCGSSIVSYLVLRVAGVFKHRDG